MGSSGSTTIAIGRLSLTLRRPPTCQPTPECRALTDVVVAGVGAVDDAVKCLRTLDAAFYRHAETVHEHEHRADQLLRQSLASLFEVGGSAVEVLKWKEIYETLEGVTDRCDDVINTIEEGWCGSEATAMTARAVALKPDVERQIVRQCPSCRHTWPADWDYRLAQAPRRLDSV